MGIGGSFRFFVGFGGTRFEGFFGWNFDLAFVGILGELEFFATDGHVVEGVGGGRVGVGGSQDGGVVLEQIALIIKR